MDESDESGRNALTIVRHMRACKTCGLRFMLVDWLPWRMEGYCSKACRPWRDDSPAGKDGAAKDTLCIPYQAAVPSHQETGMVDSAVARVDG